MAFLRRTYPTLSKMLILSEADVRRCLPMSLAIAANRKALGSLRKEKDGGAVVPSRIGLPYFDQSITTTTTTTTTSAGTGTTDGSGTSSDPCDWTLFKPAAYYPPTIAPDDDDDDGGGRDETLMATTKSSIGGTTTTTTITTTDDNDDDRSPKPRRQHPTIKNKSNVMGLRNVQQSYDNTNRFANNNDNIITSSATPPPPPSPLSSSSSSSIIMGLKIVSIRANNPRRFHKPTVPASIFLVDAATGEVTAMLGGTYLTAARTAAGSAIATEICWRKRLAERKRRMGGDGDDGGLRLVVFGAGLQGDCHVEAIRHLLPLSHLTIVNRTLPRATTLRRKIGAASPSSSSSLPISTVLLSDRDAVRAAVRSADVVVTATNASTPLFDGSWMKRGCHVNGVGSYTSRMREVDEVLVKRCRVLIDTEEAMSVGDLTCLGDGGGGGNVVGLLGDVLAGNIAWEDRYEEGLDGTFFKSVGTAIQDVVTAYEVVTRARELGLGVEVDM